MFGTKLIKQAAVGIAVVIAFASAATATTFTLTGGSSSTLPGNFDASLIGGPTPLPQVGDPITVYNGLTDYSGLGLSLASSSLVKYTFMGKEASASNALVTIGGQTLSNNGAIGSSITVSELGGTLSFLFSTIENLWEDINSNGISSETLTIANGGASTFSGLSIAFGSIFNQGRSVLVFFGDGRGDNDFDDMVLRIDAVPLPASLLMLLGGVGGLGALRLRKNKKAATA